MEAPTSTKRKISIDTIANPSKLRKVVAINPPQSPRRRRSILRGGSRETISTPPQCEHIACRLSGTGTCREPETTPFAILEEEVTSRNTILASELPPYPPEPQPQPQPDPRPRKSISWHPTVTDSNRTQTDLENYHELVYGPNKFWWEDQHLLKACESVLTSPGKLLDAFMVLSPEDVNNIVVELPVPIRKMAMEISRQLADNRDMLEWEGEDSMEGSEVDEELMMIYETWKTAEYATGDEGPIGGHDSSKDAEDATGDEKSMRGSGSSEHNSEKTEDEEPLDVDSETQKTKDQSRELYNRVDISYIAPEESLAHRRALLEYLDSRLDQFIFCRYLGAIQVPAVSPLSIQRDADPTSVDGMTKRHGPTSYIVSHFNCKTRPFLSPIRFSQASMAMKEYRLGQNPKRWIRTLKDFDVHYGKTANHCVSLDYWITNDRLLVRTQSWIYAHSDTPQAEKIRRNFLNGEIIPAYDNGNIMSWMCRHLMSNPDKHLFDFMNPQESAKLQRCKECAMEYRIDVVKSIPVNYTSVTHHPLINFCAVVTVWRDFGRCLSPYDPRWAAHFSEYESGSFTSHFPVEKQAARCASEEECATDWELGGIMRAYEGSDDYHVATELSLRGPILKWLVSTEESRQREADEIKAKEIEKQQLQEVLEVKLEVAEEKTKSLAQRLELFLSRRRK
ncbi:hypothetical protein VTL71DRAFT_11731 [Oculimacula yallundae]|uniref:Uncharacterized protein n=1 Tax=Oculimacula yallundae TaxID=86028 RepID=A0ABR4CRJ2_9HELO